MMGNTFLYGTPTLRKYIYANDVIMNNILEKILEVEEQAKRLPQIGGFRLSKWAGSFVQTVIASDYSWRLEE